MTGPGMNIETQIETYLASLPAQKQADMRTLQRAIRAMRPEGRLWFLDGKDERGKVVTNPNIGFGELDKRYADGGTRAFYQVGISGNTTGISVYIMGIDDRTYLPRTYGDAIGKATVTGYCIKFKRLDDIDLDTLKRAIQDGFAQACG